MVITTQSRYCIFSPFRIIIENPRKGTLFFLNKQIFLNEKTKNQTPHRLTRTKYKSFQGNICRFTKKILPLQII
jgi:hypothetical protein